MKLILASQSPRRKEILESVGLKFDIMPVDADESLPEGIEGADAVTMLARRKAKALYESHPELADCLILGRFAGPQQLHHPFLQCTKPLSQKDFFLI